MKKRHGWNSAIFILLILTNVCVQLDQKEKPSTTITEAEGEQCLGGWDKWDECGGCRRLSQRSCKDNEDLIQTRPCIIGKFFFIVRGISL